MHPALHGRTISSPGGLIRLLSHEDAEIQIVRVNYNALTGSLEMRIAVFHDGPRATLDVTVVNFQFWNPN